MYVGEGLTNMRLGMTLETATTTGAIVGGLTAALLPAEALLLIFSVFLVTSTAVLLFVGKEGGERQEVADDPAISGHEEPRTLAGSFVSPERASS